MDESAVAHSQLTVTAKHLARRLLTISENRLELLAVEMQEGRERLLRALVLALGVATFGLLTALAFTAAIVFWFWARSPLAVLLMLTALYGIAGICLGRQLRILLRDWQTLPISLDQLRKDRAGLEKFFL